MSSLDGGKNVSNVFLQKVYVINEILLFVIASGLCKGINVILPQYFYSITSFNFLKIKLAHEYWTQHSTPNVKGNFTMSFYITQSSICAPPIVANVKGARNYREDF